jgi:hypothetical protein
MDVVVSRYPTGHGSIVHKLRGWDDQILAPGGNARLRLDFSEELAGLQLPEDACGYLADLVVSDLSRQVAIQYEYIWVLGRFSSKAGLPWRVRWRYRIRSLGWKYYRVRRWLSRSPDKETSAI